MKLAYLPVIVVLMVLQGTSQCTLMILRPLRPPAVCGFSASMKNQLSCDIVYILHKNRSTEAMTVESDVFCIRNKIRNILKKRYIYICYIFEKL